MSVHKMDSARGDGEIGTACGKFGKGIKAAWEWSDVTCVECVRSWNGYDTDGIEEARERVLHKPKRGVEK